VGFETAVYSPSSLTNGSL